MADVDLDLLNSWDYDVFDFRHEQLIAATCLMFLQLGLVYWEDASKDARGQAMAPLRVLWCFLEEVRQRGNGWDSRAAMARSAARAPHHLATSPPHRRIPHTAHRIVRFDAPYSTCRARYRHLPPCDRCRTATAAFRITTSSTAWTSRTPPSD
jgi:hypothetical protein